METSVFLALALACAPQVPADTARALVSVESAFNPWAIGVVGGALVRQPANLPEAVATVAALEAAGWNYSVGLGQINKRNFERYGLSPETAFEPCANLNAMQGILGDCFSRASRRRAPRQAALRDAFSCYYSGNFLTGHQHGYVDKVLAAWSSRAVRVGNAQTGVRTAAHPSGTKPAFTSTDTGRVPSQDSPLKLTFQVFTPGTQSGTPPGASP